LRGEVGDLREELLHAQQCAHQVLHNQQEDFRRAAEQYHAQQRDNAEAQLATGEARVQAHYQAQLGQAQAVIDRTQQRLQNQYQDLNDRATRAFQQQQQTHAVHMQDLRTGITQEASDAMAQRQDALAHEANEYVQDRERQMQNMWNLAEGNLMQRNAEVQR